MRSRKRAVVRADAHGHAALPAEQHQRREPLADALQLRQVLLVRVFDDLEFLRVRVVAGIDAHFLHPLGRFQRGLGLEMDIGHDRHVAALAAQPPHDVLQIRRILHRGRGDADDLATHLRQRERLLHTRLRVHGVARHHRLHPDGIRPADSDRADHAPPGWRGVR